MFCTYLCTEDAEYTSVDVSSQGSSGSSSTSCRLERLRRLLGGGDGEVSTAFPLCFERPWTRQLSFRYLERASVGCRQRTSLGDASSVGTFLRCPAAARLNGSFFLLPVISTCGDGQDTISSDQVTCADSSIHKMIVYSETSV